MAGWVELNAGATTTYCEKWEWDKDDKPTFIDYPDDGHYGFSLKIYKRTVKIHNLFFTTKAAYDTFQAELEAMQTTAAYTLRIKTTTAGAYEFFNGTNNTMPVLFISQKGNGKLVWGDAAFYQIKLLTLRQAGVLSTT